MLAGLHPGRYGIRIGLCAGDGLAGRRAPVSVWWPDPPGVVTVAGGQIRTLRPAIAWHGQYGVPAAGGPQVSTRSQTGSISGRVTGNGRPLRRVCAVAIASASGFRDQPPPHGTTLRSGRYRISGLRPGRYQVVFRTGLRSCPDSANWLPQWYPYLNSAYPPDKAADVRVRAGRNTARVDGKLKLGGEIAGTVRARAGRPLRGICVSFYTSFYLNGIYAVDVAAVSGKSGRYTLHGLFPGSYQVQFAIGCGSKGDYAPQWWHSKAFPYNANGIKVAGRQIVRGIDAALPPGAAVTGTVRARTPRAAPLAGICVQATQRLGDGAAAVTARNGTYRLAGLFPGSVRISFDPACRATTGAGYLPGERSLTVRAGHTRAGINAYLRPAAGISGVVRDPARKPASPCVTIGDQNRDYTFADADGRYAITGIQPGQYTVSFDSGCDNTGSLAPQWYNDKPDSGSADLLAFTAGNVNHLNVTLHPGGTLAGIVRWTSGRPASGDCVTAATSPGQQGTGAGDQTTSSPDGRYRIQDLPPGEYEISFGCGYGPYPGQWFRSQPDATTAEFLALNPGVTTTLNQRLSRAGSIKGTVTDTAGHPLSGICVEVANARNGQYVTPADNGAMTHKGHYQVGQLTPGRYLLQFTDCNNDVRGSQWYRGRNSESFATPVTVHGGQITTRINGRLSAGGTITGRITGPAGKPASSTCVYATDPAAGNHSDLFFTGPNGKYRITGLSSGTYSLNVTQCAPGSPNLASITLARPVRISAPQHIAGLDVKLAAGGTITGTMTGSSAEPGPRGQACVLTMPANPDGSYQVTWTDTRGRYRLTGLAAGTYQVYFADPSCDNAFGATSLAPQWYDNQPDQPIANLITVSAGSTTGGSNAILQPSGGVEGTVTSHSASGVGGECVTALPVHASPDPWTGQTPPPDIAITTPAGRYRVPDLLPGQYKIEFSDGCGDAGFATQWWQAAASEKAAQPITVTNTLITGINATLQPRAGQRP